MEYVADLFLASVSSCLKKTGILKMYAICCVSFFFCNALEFFFAQKFNFFQKCIVPISKKWYQLEKPAALLRACLFS